MKPIKDTTKQMEEKQVCVNPSYDKSLPIEKDLLTFWGSTISYTMVHKHMSPLCLNMKVNLTIDVILTLKRNY